MEQDKIEKEKETAYRVDESTNRINETVDMAKAVITEAIADITAEISEFKVAQGNLANVIVMEYNKVICISIICCESNSSNNNTVIVYFVIGFAIISNSALFRFKTLGINSFAGDNVNCISKQLNTCWAIYKA